MTRPPTLDDEARARIRAEEQERLKVREELARERRIKTRPSYWAGAFLNLIVSGAGLMFIGQVGAGLAWLAGAIALSFVLTPYISWPIALIGSFIHYDNAYASLYATDEEMRREREASKTTRFLLAFIAVLLVLGVWVLPAILKL